MEWFVNWSIWHWLILGFVLLIAEIAMPGVFLLWWGLAAIVVAGIMKLFPDLPLSSLAVIYAIIAMILSVILVALSAWVKIKPTNPTVH